ncbi:hypothetical protein BJ742DRAFT_781749 [Cladochytrium replicatum]|nr:hypothetical protein BJ742DRAFT_781749 [Cladochytrium replicatum]
MRVARHTSGIEAHRCWYTESGEQICTSIPKVNVIPYPHASSASYKRNRSTSMGAYRVWRADLYLDPKGYVIPHPHASSASYKRNRSTSMLVYRVWRADLYLDPKVNVIPYPHASSASYKRNRSTSMGAYRVWRADLYLDPKGYVIPHPHASSASYKRNRSTSMLVYRVWRADLYLDPKGYVIPYPQEVHRCWYTESGEQVRIRTGSHSGGHVIFRGPYLANFGVGFRLNRARARLAPHTSQIDEEGHFWYTESGEQVRTSQTLELVSGSTAPARDWHPIQAEQKKYTAGFNNQAKNVLWFGRLLPRVT